MVNVENFGRSPALEVDKCEKQNKRKNQMQIPKSSLKKIEMLAMSYDSQGIITVVVS